MKKSILVLIVFFVLMSTSWAQIKSVTSFNVTNSAHPQSASKVLNLRGHQHHAILSSNGYQYVAFYSVLGNNLVNRFVNIGRRKLPDGAWETIRFTDYRQTKNDSHNVIALGICEGNGTLHMIFDQHNGSVPLRYRVSVEGLTSNPEQHSWQASKFGPVLGALTGISANAVGNKFFTYPRFITMPNGNLQLIRRHGSAVNGASHIYTYNKDTKRWIHHGEFINGRAVEYTKPDTGAKTKLGPYLNGANYQNNRLHITWIWRTTGTTSNNNFDFMYAYSDDYGITWKNNSGVIAGRAGSSPMTYKNSVPVKVFDFPEGRGLTNQTGQTVDDKGRVHVYQTRNAAGGRRFMHLYSNDNGNWINHETDHSSQRGKITHDAESNIYAIHRSGSILKATEANNFTDWKFIRNNSDFAGEAHYDENRMETDNIISMFVAKPDSSKEMLSIDLEVEKTILNVNSETLERVFLYPNPSSSGIFNLKTSNTWFVYNLLGAKIKEGIGSSINIALQPKGIYLLKIPKTGKSFKLIKN
jgi:hypothetical protein